MLLLQQKINIFNNIQQNSIDFSVPIIIMQPMNLRNARYGAHSITEGTIWKALLTFFFPILFGTFFQQLYNTIDAIVVGRFVGKQALAAVGGGSAVFVNLIVGFFVGLTSGAGVLISQFYGAKNNVEISRSVHTSIALSLVCGILMTVLGTGFSTFMLTITKTPADTLSLSTTYLRIFFLGMVPMSLYNMCSSILRAVGNSRTPLIILIIGCGTNILLDVIFVIVLKLGVAGVAIATDLCQIITAILSLALLIKTKESYQVCLKKVSVTPHILAHILKLGFPAGIQSSLYTISNLIIQTFINSFGTNHVAAWAAYGKIDAVFWMMINALGIAITTFAGQNYGAHKYDRVKKGMWQSLLLAVIFTALFSIAFELTGKYLFMMFSPDDDVIREGVRIMRFLIPFWGTFISIEIVSGTIRGAGKSFVPMVITVFGVCLLRILWLFTAVPHKNDMQTVIASYPITWTITSIMFWIYYASGKWLTKSTTSSPQ